MSLSVMINFNFAARTGAKYCDDMSVCLFASVNRKPHVRISPILLCTLPVAVARSSTDGVDVMYFQFSGCLNAMWPIGQCSGRRTSRTDKPVLEID